MKNKIISILCILAIIAAGSYFCYEYVYTSLRAAKANREASESLIEVNGNIDEETLKQQYRLKYPNINFPDDLLLKYYPAFIKNQDLKGWIKIPELDIDLPIVQGRNNNEYLRLDFNRQYSIWGVPFFDSSNSFNPNSKNLIIYGHNFKYNDKPMFAALKKYTKIETLKKAPIIQCDTIYEEAYWKIISIIILNSDNPNDNFNYLQPEFDETGFTNYLAELKNRTLFYTGIDVTLDDSLLTLSTCYYSSKNARLVITARKVRPNETIKIDTNQISVKKQ